MGRTGQRARQSLIRLSRRTTLTGALAASLSGRTARSEQRQSPVVLRRGVNTWPWMSLTREFPPPRTDYDWPPFQPQRPVPHLADLRRLRDAGFDFVRIPVDPGPLLSFAGDKRARLIDMLIACTTLALDADLAVVVNIQANDATHYWTSNRMVASRDSPQFARYLALVTDVARILGRLDTPHVVLEPVNEPPQRCASEEWEQVQISLLTAARTSAPKLTLMATGSCGSMVPGLVGLEPEPLAKFGPLLFTFHFYEPYLFSHQGAPWMREPVYRDLNSVPWPASAGSLEQTLSAVRTRMDADAGITDQVKRETEAITERLMADYFRAQPDRAYLDRHLSKIAEWSARHAIPAGQIVMGEFGALRTDTRYVAAKAPDRARYIRDVREAAEAFGFGWAFWNLFDGMGLMDDATRGLDPVIVSSLGLTLPAN